MRFFRYFILISFLLSPLSFSVIAEPTFTISSVTYNLKLVKLDETETKDLFDLKSGDQTSAEALEKLKTRMLATTLFESVDISLSGSSVAVSAVESRLIRKIYIAGNYPYLSTKIIRLSGLLAGDPYHPDLIKVGEEKITQFYEKNGYYGTKVTIIPTLDDKYYVANLKIDIDRGKKIPISDVIIEGHEAFLREKVRRIFDIQKFSLNKIRKKTHKLQEKYAKKGYVRARVKMAGYFINKEANNVEVSLLISERKKLIVTFEGNKNLRKRTLLKETTFTEERGYDRFSVDRSREKLLFFYKENGFPFASIETSYEKTEDTVDIGFHIAEGPQVRIGKIKFNGNKEIGSRKLKKAMELKSFSFFEPGFYKEDLVASDLSRIVQYYHDHGFFDAKITSWKLDWNSEKNRIIFDITVDEGQPYTIEAIHVQEGLSFDNKTLVEKSNLKVGKRFETKKILNAEKRIFSFYQKKGYPYIRPDITEVHDTEKKQVFLTITAVEGKKADIRHIIIQGNHTTKESFIRDVLYFKENNPYTYKKLLDSQLELKRLGIFDYVLISPLGVEDEKDKVDILVKVTERKSITLDVQAGFDSDDLATAQVTLTKRNLFHSAKQISLKGIVGFETNRAEVNYFSPHFFANGWNFLAQGFAQNVDDESLKATSYGGFAGILKNFGSQWAVLFKTGVTDVNLDEAETSADEENLFDSTFFETSINLTLDTRNNFADPTRGVYISATNELDLDLNDPSNNFNISKLNMATYIGDRNFTFINQLRLGSIYRIQANPRVPAQKLFYLGGSTTLRGFEEDAIKEDGGKNLILYTAEAQFRLFGSFKVAGFFDTGSLEDTIQNVSADSFRESAGIGLRYITPIGPIKLDYAFVLDPRDGEDTSRLHFSFGTFF